jgi:diguanylate cyclase (GGDEF)-like protein
MTERRHPGAPAHGSANSSAVRAAIVAAGFTALAIGAVSMWRAEAPGVDGLRPRMSSWLLAAMFALAQFAPLHVQRGREARSVTLSELPFVLGLLFVPAPAFILARTVGGAATVLIRQRQYRNPVKLAFNIALFVDEAVIGVALFRCLDIGSGAHSPWAWIAVVVASVVSNTLGGLAVAVLIELIEGRPDRRRLIDTVAQFAPQSLVVSVLGLDVALAAGASDWAFIPLTVGLVVLLLSYRAYAALAERHSVLEHLYGFTRALAQGVESDSVTSVLLDQCAMILHADHARLVRIDPATRTAINDVGRTREGGIETCDDLWLSAADRWLLAQVVDRGRTVLIHRETPDDAARLWLARNGLCDAVLVPLQLDSAIEAVLVVADRKGEARSFDEGDVRLFEALAAQASVSLGNGRLVEQLRHSSLHDAVTGIPNRTYLEQTLAERLAAPDGQSVALAMVGLDAIKEVNDAFGHHHGDAIVREVARRLSESVGTRGVVARFGGAELAVVINHCSSMGAVEGAVASFLRPLTEPIIVEDTAIDVGPCAGIAVAPLHATTHVDLIKCADVAMYAAMNNGVEVAVYDPDSDTSSKQRLALVAALRRAIAADAITIDIQPKATASDGSLVSVEALARWTDPELGVIPPGDFIPVAEHSGLIRPLTEVVLGKALAACADWQSVAPGVGVAVNISARLLQQGEIDVQVVHLLHRHGLPASMLTLEITESSLMADTTRTAEMLRRLRKLGASLSIDDFGTGYSSLSYLQQLPVTEVKIDQSFIRRMQDDAYDAKIVRAIIQLGHALNLVVVAEGVEDQPTQDALTRMGVDLIQGYHLARPMPTSAFPQWCADYYGTASRRLSVV